MGLAVLKKQNLYNFAKKDRKIEKIRLSRDFIGFLACRSFLEIIRDRQIRSLDLSQWVVQHNPDHLKRCTP